MWAWKRWPGERLYTYVDPKKIKSTNPGYCFKVCGWRKCGVTKHRKLHILERYQPTAFTKEEEDIAVEIRKAAIIWNMRYRISGPTILEKTEKQTPFEAMFEPVIPEDL